MEGHGLSQRRAFRLVGIGHCTLSYQRRRDNDEAVRKRLRELAAQRRRFGYRRLGWLLAREGHAMDHKKVYRLYIQPGNPVQNAFIESFNSKLRGFMPRRLKGEWDR